MSIYVKELIIVAVLSGLVFRVAKPVALSFMEESDFKRRRNIWMVLSAVAFLSPTFWWFTLFAAPILYWGGKRDNTPLAFYLLLMNVIPSIPVPIPTAGLGINQLFNLDIYRILSLCVLIPYAARLRSVPVEQRITGLQGMDFLLLAFGTLQVALYVPPDLPSGVILHTSATNVLREAFLFFIDVYMLYYVASRSCANRRAMLDVLATFVLACLIVASLATFESVKHWLLYTGINDRWGGDHLNDQYLYRAGLLRAKASTGHPLALGYLLAVAFGVWQYLKSRVRDRFAKIAVPVLLWIGLFVSFSRGPWLGALAIYLTYSALRARSASHLFKAALTLLVIAGIILISPIGERMRTTLPFLGGNKAEASVTYRKLLLERSWQLIKEHPLLGDQHALSQMQDLRQGQGIIDIVNTYVGVTLFYGFTGLAIFLGFILAALMKARRAAKAVLRIDSDLALLGASLAACIVGTLLMLSDCGFDLGYKIMFFVLAGMCSAYFLLARTPDYSAVGDTAAHPAAELR